MDGKRNLYLDKLSTRPHFPHNQKGSNEFSATTEVFPDIAHTGISSIFMKEVDRNQIAFLPTGSIRKEYLKNTVFETAKVIERLAIEVPSSKNEKTVEKMLDAVIHAEKIRKEKLQRKWEENNATIRLLNSLSKMSTDHLQNSTIIDTTNVLKREVTSSSDFNFQMSRTDASRIRRLCTPRKPLNRNHTDRFESILADVDVSQCYIRGSSSWESLARRHTAAESKN